MRKENFNHNLVSSLLGLILFIGLSASIIAKSDPSLPIGLPGTNDGEEKSKAESNCVSDIRFINEKGPTHSNRVGELRLINRKDKLYLEAILDKRFLAMALKYGTGCTPQETLSKCGNQYFKDRIKVTANESQLQLSKLSMEVQREFVIYKYELGDLEEKVTSIEIESAYMIDKYEHAILSVTIGMYGIMKNYSFTDNRKKISLKF